MSMKGFRLSLGSEAEQCSEPVSRCSTPVVDRGSNVSATTEDLVRRSDELEVLYEQQQQQDRRSRHSVVDESIDSDEFTDTTGEVDSILCASSVYESCVVNDPSNNNGGGRGGVGASQQQPRRSAVRRSAVHQDPAAAGGRQQARTEDEVAVEHIQGLFRVYKDRIMELREQLTKAEYEKSRFKGSMARELQERDLTIAQLRQSLRESKDECVSHVRTTGIQKVTIEGLEVELDAKKNSSRALSAEVESQNEQIRQLKLRVAQLEGQHQRGPLAALTNNTLEQLAREANVADQPHQRRGVVVSGFRAKDKKQIEEMVTSLGAEVVNCPATKRLPAQVTHVVAGSFTPKVIGGLLSDGVWVVPPSFVYKSANDGRFAAEDTFRDAVKGNYHTFADTKGYDVCVTTSESRDAGNMEVRDLLRDFGIAIGSSNDASPGVLPLTDFVSGMRPRFLSSSTAS